MILYLHDYVCDIYSEQKSLARVQFGDFGELMLVYQTLFSKIIFVLVMSCRAKPFPQDDFSTNLANLENYSSFTVYIPWPHISEWRP